MIRKQLVFPNPANAWDFITATKISNVDVEDATVSGLFTDSDIQLACDDFGATVQDAPIPPAGISDPAAPPPDQEVKLTGKSGKSYSGRVYATHDRPSDLPQHAILCLSVGTPLNGGWHYALNSVFYTDQVDAEVRRFQQRDDLTHIIVIPVKKGEVKGVDDLVQHYLHR